jgi:hypothetical protein
MWSEDGSTYQHQKTADWLVDWNAAKNKYEQIDIDHIKWTLD